MLNLTGLTMEFDGTREGISTKELVIWCQGRYEVSAFQKDAQVMNKWRMETNG